jgi:hypothetical protein
MIQIYRFLFSALGLFANDSVSELLMAAVLVFEYGQLMSFSFATPLSQLWDPNSKYAFYCFLRLNEWPIKVNIIIYYILLGIVQLVALYVLVVMTLCFVHSHKLRKRHLRIICILNHLIPALNIPFIDLFMTAFKRAESTPYITFLRVFSSICIATTCVYYLIVALFIIPQYQFFSNALLLFTQTLLQLQSRFLNMFGGDAIALSTCIQFCCALYHYTIWSRYPFYCSNRLNSILHCLIRIWILFTVCAIVLQVHPQNIPLLQLIVLGIIVISLASVTRVIRIRGGNTIAEVCDLLIIFHQQSTSHQRNF